MKETQQLCTVLVSSCDSYEDLWQPFFTLLHRQWPDNPFPVALCTESKAYTGPFAPQQCLHPQKPDAAWTARLRQGLGQLHTPYVLLLLDDFFFTGKIDTSRVLQCLAWMQQDPDAACFSFYPTTGNEPAPYPGFEKRPQQGLYRFNAQAGLWRRTQLMEFLCVDEDAWQWENTGNLRSFAVPQAFYSEKDTPDRIFPYDYMRHGLIGGKWFPETKDLFEQYGIQADFSRRGFYDPQRWMFLPSVQSAFALDSVLYPDAGAGFQEQTAVPAQENLRQGAFCQRFSLPEPVRCRAIRWDPATRAGFSLENVQVRVHYADGGEQTLPLRKAAGNARRAEGQLVFLKPDPQLIFALDGKRLVEGVTVSGVAHCPITEEMFRQLCPDKKESWLQRLAGCWKRR